VRDRPAVIMALALASLAVPALGQTPVVRQTSVHAEAPRPSDPAPASAPNGRPVTPLSGLVAKPAAPTDLSELVIVTPSKKPPAVVATYPAAGAVVQPGALILKVTFDQKMRPDDWRFDRAGERYPACLARPRLLTDEKTFVLLCTVGGDGKFEVQLNGPGAGGFANLAKQRATPLLMTFSTQAGAALSSIKDAIKSAGLKDEDDPVMDNRPAAPVRQASTDAKPTP
jgi:hypothetical protein